MNDPAPTATSVPHVAGLGLTWDGHYHRQRCAWCGAVIEDVDLALVARPLLDDGTADESPWPEWPIGALIRIVGGTRAVIRQADDDEPVPEDSCMRIDPAVTV